MRNRSIIRASWTPTQTLATCTHPSVSRKSCYTVMCVTCKASWTDIQHKMGGYSYQGNCKEVSTCSACGSTASRTSHQGYSGANCYSPARCDCGAKTSGSALGHDWVYNHHAESSHPHYMVDECRRCHATRTTSTQASWYWTYGSWYSINGSEHKRVKTCSRCPHQSSETGSHGGWSYGNWYSVSDSQHKRTKTCGTCGYQSSEIGGHSLSWGRWYEDSSAGQCKAQGNCMCGYVGVKWKSHSYSNWYYSTSSATNCKKYADCSDCSGGRTYQYPSHSFGDEYSENGYKKIKCIHCGYVKVLGEDVGDCTHPNAKWGDWFELYITSSVSQCAREYKCQKCKKVLDSQVQDHSPSNSGVYEPYNETYHYEVGTCRCGKTTKKTVAHTFIDNKCVCGAIYNPNGGGVAVKINSFTANPSSNGDYIHCYVSATGAVRYTFNLFVYAGIGEDIISSSGLTQSTYHQFQTIPDRTYMVSVTASDSYGRTDYKEIEVRTPNVMPKAFKWTNSPTAGKEFRESITARDWTNLQNTINAWRSRDMLHVYGYTMEYANENSFIIAKQDKAFTYHYFNQIINALSEISHLSYTLPKRKTTDPKKWLAKDFLELEKAVNSLRK